MEYRNYSAKTLDEAITMASIDLGVTSSELYYEITEKGSTGFLGIGKKDVEIKACPLSEKEKADKLLKEEVKEQEPTKRIEKAAENKSEAVEEKKEQPKADVEMISKVAEDFLLDVFSAMNIDVKCDISFSERDNSLSIDLSGDHMGIIIGKRGQTLDSLQYLVNLVVNKNSETYIRIKLDTEDYRRRRKETLENLAKNIAHKVKKSGKPVTLEAMNPYERRTIHYALQKDRYVTTYSEGDEPFRHVVVTVKK